MEVQINGNKANFESDTLSLLEVLDDLGIREGQSGVAVAINFSVIPRSNWATTLLNESDAVEVIRATAGG